MFEQTTIGFGFQILILQNTFLEHVHVKNKNLKHLLCIIVRKPLWQIIYKYLIPSVNVLK